METKPKPSARIDFVSEAKIEEGQRIIEKLIDELREERKRIIATQEQTEQEIKSVEENLEFHADGEEKFRPILNSLLESKARLGEIISLIDAGIAKSEASLALAKKEDEERRAKLLNNFNGTKQ